MTEGEEVGEGVLTMLDEGSSEAALGVIAGISMLCGVGRRR